MKMVFLWFLIFCFCLATLCFAQATNDLATRESGIIEFPVPRKPLSSINELPDVIRNKLEAHLQKRLGPFYSKIHFTSSYYINLSETHRLYPYTVSWPEMGDYYLKFEFSALDKGIKSFTAEIRLDDKGNVVKEIELPDIGSHPEKSELISRIEARRIAAKKGFPSGPEEPLIDYDAASDNFVWEARKITSDHGYYLTRTTLLLDAHSGKIIRQDQTEGMR